jgi:hypothetical protein
MRGNVLFVTADPRRSEGPSALAQPVARTDQAEQALAPLQLGTDGGLDRRDARRR